MIVFLLLLTASFVFAVCPTGLGTSLELSSKTVKNKGKNYRRADVLIFIPIEKEEIVREVSVVRSKVELQHVGEGKFLVSVFLRNISDITVDGAILRQPLNRNRIGERVEALRVISRVPYIFEPLSLFVTDMSDREALIKLPPLKPGEELELRYVVIGEKKPVKPSVEKVQSALERKSKRIYMLVAKYSLLFGYGKVRTEDINLRNIREILDGFRRAGLKPVVKIVGLADGVTRNSRKNKEIAERRARYVARKVLGGNYACYMRRAFAENFR